MRSTFCTFCVVPEFFSLFVTLSLNLSFYFLFFVKVPTPMPALAIKSCLVLLKCSAADADAIVILFLPYHLCFGQMFQTSALIDSFAFCVHPGRHLVRGAGSLSLL